MAKFSDVNTIGTGAAAVFRLKEVLKAAGWTVPSSSDGLTYNASGDQISHSGSGAGGMANNSAWFIVREPGGRREWCLQRGTINTIWRAKYSANAKFSGGSPSSVRVPAAADEQVIYGGGTDASPSFTAWFLTDGTYRIHIIANSTPIGGVYQVIMFATLTPGSTYGAGGFWQEPMAPGSYDPADGDPCIVGIAPSGSIGSLILGSSKGWLAYGTGSQAWAAIVSGVNATFTGSLPPDLVNGKDVNGRPIYTAISAGTRIKGYGATIAIRGPSRVYPATANRATDAYVYIDNLVVPYADATEPGV